MQSVSSVQLGNNLNFAFSTKATTSYDCRVTNELCIFKLINARKSNDFVFSPFYILEVSTIVNIFKY